MSWEVLKEKGNSEFKKNNYQSAIQIYTDAISLDPDQEVLFANRSLCYKSLNNFRQSLSDLNKALNINPKSIKNLKRKFELLIILGNFTEAEHIAQLCVNIEPKQYTHLNDVKRAKELVKKLNTFYDAYHSENFVKSDDIGKELMTICPGNSDFKLAYMDSMINNGKLVDAQKFYSQNLNDSERSDDESLYLMGKIFYYEGNYDKARSLVKKLLQRVNDNQKYNKLFQNINTIDKEKESANAIFKSGKYQEAIEAYTKLIEIDSKNNMFNSTILANRALCHHKLGNNLEAMNDMKKSLTLNEKYTKGYLRRAIIYMALENYEQARYDYQKVLDLEPSNSDAKKGLEEAKKLEKQAKKKDYYKVLGVDKSANENQIRKAYKVLALKWHPDKNNQSESQREVSEKRFKEITEAYEILSDPKKKQMFDNGMDPNDPESGAGFHAGNPHDIFSMFFGGGGGGFPGEDDGFSSGGFGGGPFSQFFTTSSGGSGGSNRGGGTRTFTFKFG